MIVAQTTGGTGTPVLLLGLSAENVRRLQAGQPIDVPHPWGADAPPNAPRIVIFGGRGTEEDLRAQLAEYFELPDEDPS